MNINISNLTSSTEYFIEISAFVIRPDIVTGERIILQSDYTALQIKTGGKDLSLCVVTFATSVYIVPLPMCLIISNYFNIKWILFCIRQKCQIF